MDGWMMDERRMDVGWRRKGEGRMDGWMMDERRMDVGWRRKGG